MAIDDGSVRYRIGVLDGDGIGAEIVPAAVEVLDAALRAADAPAVEWVPLLMGHAAIEAHGAPLPAETVETLGGLEGWLLGPHDSASYPEPHRSQLNPSGTLRKHFDLFANIRPAKSLEGVPGTTTDADLVIVRENTEGFYADRNMFFGVGEFMPTSDVAIAMGVITRGAVHRIAKEAFELASRRRKHVTIVHKANVLRVTTGMFRDVCREVAADYPQVTVDDFHIDAMAAHLVRRAADFDVVVAENMFGDILSDLAGELVGSLGLVPSVNISERHGMAQAAHGSAPDIAGRDLANPIAMILSGAMLFEWLGGRGAQPAFSRAAERVEAGVAAAVRDGTRTPDMGGNAGTREFTGAVAAAAARG